MLSVFKPQRAYEAQFYVSEFDLRGVMKRLEELMHQCCEDGNITRAYSYAMAHLTLNVMFFGYGGEGESGCIDYPHEYVQALESAMDEFFESTDTERKDN